MGYEPPTACRRRSTIFTYGVSKRRWFVVDKVPGSPLAIMISFWNQAKELFLHAKKEERGGSKQNTTVIIQMRDFWDAAERSAPAATNNKVARRQTRSEYM